MSKKREVHPSKMKRHELEKELLALRVWAGAMSDAIGANEVEITIDGKARLDAAKSTIHMIYGMA